MNRLEYIQKINAYFSYLVMQIQGSIACNLFDINRVAEDFYIPILRIIYGCDKLENKNVIKLNFPAIDLGCDQSRISFQVTSDNSSAKVTETLKKFEEHGLSKKYDKLYVLLITTKQKSYSSRKLDAEIKKQRIAFDKAEDIIDYTDLMSKISTLNIEILEQIYQIMKREFSKQESYNICRDELENFLAISNARIEVEKKTKKYIPSIFTEPTYAKDLIRGFTHPLFFYRKIEDKLLSVDYDTFNKFLSMMGLEKISNDIGGNITKTPPNSISSVLTYLEVLKKSTEQEKQKISPYNPWGAERDQRKDFTVAEDKQAIKSLLKLKREAQGYSINRKYDDALKLIKIAQSKIFLVTSMAGQGKTNFVCDLIENQFKPFEIPSVFVPARELNYLGE